jgi:Zn-dependent protease with chaperone function
MISIKGTWYDGQTSADAPAVCQIYDNGALTVLDSEDGHRIISLSRFSVRLSPRLANTPRYIYFPDGEKFETGDNDTVDRVMKRFSHSRMQGWLHRLESHWKFVLIALVAMIIFLWGGLKYGVPLAARQVANRLPVSILDAAAEQTLSILDQTVLNDTELDETVQQRIQSHFQPVIDGHPEHSLTILFRKGGQVGPNAFALPNGTIVFTDEMVRLAEHDQELVGILSHEIGHVVHRHGLRAVIQDSLLGFALLAITGDVTGSSELFLGIPVVLTQLAYSREFEREADQYALTYLRGHGISPHHFVRLMQRIEESTALNRESSEGQWAGYLSTHPLTAERIEPFQNATR